MYQQAQLQQLAAIIANSANPAATQAYFNQLHQQQTAGSSPSAASTPGSVNNGYGPVNNNDSADAQSTATEDWAAVRQAESSANTGGCGYTCGSGAYGFIASPSAYDYLGFSLDGYSSWSQVPPSVQDQIALALFAHNGDKFSGTWNNGVTASGGGPLR